MSGFKVLIDTNIVIGLEDTKPVQASLAELARLSSQHGVGLFVEGANYDDVQRDRDVARRVVTLSKLEKFQRLRGLPPAPEQELVQRFGPIKDANDRSDVRLLTAVDVKAVDFLVTQDGGLHRRAERAGLGASVLTIEDALDWLRQTFQQKPVSLPYVLERKAYEIDTRDPIFVSLRADYHGFDEWFDKCRGQHRDCWVLEVSSGIAGLVVRKDETFAEAGTIHSGPKILKVCTFKVRDEFRGEKFGELLLKQILWFAQRNAYDLVYLTVYPKHALLIDLLKYYGFETTIEKPTGEQLMEKSIAREVLPTPAGDIFDFDRAYYPRFYDGPTVRKFCVPIRPDYHRRLFPEIAFLAELPLFPNERFGPLLNHRQERTPGNTIRKVYLCRANIARLRPSALLLFYMSKDEAYGASQTITTLGIVEQVIDVTTTEDLIRLTAKRSVFSAAELHGWDASSTSPVKMIDFLLVGHLEAAIPLKTLVQLGILKQAPQSITELKSDGYEQLRPYLRLDFA